MQRSKVGASLESLEHLIGKNHRLVELLTAVHHAVTHGINLREILNHTNLRVGEQREDEFHALGVLGNVVHDLTFLAVGELYFHESAIESHALSATRCHHALVVHVVQCVLNGT